MNFYQVGTFYFLKNHGFVKNRGPQNGNMLGLLSQDACTTWGNLVVAAQGLPPAIKNMIRVGYI